MPRLLAITVALLLSACATNKPSVLAERAAQDKGPPMAAATAVPRTVADAAQFKRAARCMFIGDVAAIMYDDFRGAQQTDPAPLQLWKSKLDNMGIPVKYLIFAHMRYYNTHPSTSTPLAMDTSAYCVAQELPEFKDHLPRSCYAQSKAVDMFFQARKSGKSKQQIIAALTQPEMRSKGSPEDNRRMLEAAEYAYSIPADQENTPYGRTGYFAMCLAGAGDIYVGAVPAKR